MGNEGLMEGEYYDEEGDGEEMDINEIINADHYIDDEEEEDAP